MTGTSCTYIYTAGLKIYVQLVPLITLEPLELSACK